MSFLPENPLSQKNSEIIVVIKGNIIISEVSFPLL